MVTERAQKDRPRAEEQAGGQSRKGEKAPSRKAKEIPRTEQATGEEIAGLDDGLPGDGRLQPNAMALNLSSRVMTMTGTNAIMIPLKKAKPPAGAPSSHEDMKQRNPAMIRRLATRGRLVHDEVHSA